MTDRHLISPEEFDAVFHRIDKEWMLVGTANGESANVMTASWGGFGILWGRPVAFIFIRPQRFTHELLEKSERFSLSFLGESYREALRLCGRVSGREVDKFAACGLSVAKENDVPFVAEAHHAVICRKLYAAPLEKAGFLLPALLDNYKAGDYHEMYIAEIESVIAHEER